MVSKEANCEEENGILGLLSSLCLRQPFRGLDPVDIKLTDKTQETLELIKVKRKKIEREREHSHTGNITPDSYSFSKTKFKDYATTSQEAIATLVISSKLKDLFTSL